MSHNCTRGCCPHPHAHVQAGCLADAKCQAWTYVKRPPLNGSCCYKGGVTKYVHPVWVNILELIKCTPFNGSCCYKGGVTKYVHPVWVNILELVKFTPLNGSCCYKGGVTKYVHPAGLIY